MLRVEHLTKVYDNGTVALRDVSFTVEEGEFLVIIGLSGSGKSTLLRCINRLIEPTEGRIVWNGVDITALDEAGLRRVRREIGFVFQEFNLVERLPVILNVLAGRLGYVNPWWSVLYYFPKSEYQRAMAALETVGLAEKAHNRASDLSGGQKQRVGIARAIVQEPKLLLADEPVASLDPVLAHSIMGYLERLNREKGVTILCSLHYLDLVQRYATRVIGLREGRIVYEGTREDIRNMTDGEFKRIYGEEARRLGG